MVSVGFGEMLLRIQDGMLASNLSKLFPKGLLGLMNPLGVTQSEGAPRALPSPPPPPGFASSSLMQ